MGARKKCAGKVGAQEVSGAKNTPRGEEVRGYSEENLFHGTLAMKRRLAVALTTVVRNRLLLETIE